ncbi:MAG: hypothetical protein HUU54_04090 [Ignavibacteriaceae bacterium]|nr:hypothetical protein [Ignavibacteriaceae bacterium]
MEEIVLNIYLDIDDGRIKNFRAASYRIDGSDEEKVNFLRSKVEEDYSSSYKFDAPQDERGGLMTWKSFEKLRKRNLEIGLFEEIFSEFGVPDEPLILVTPVIDGKVGVPA